MLSPAWAERALDPRETSSLTRIRIQQLMDTVEVYRKVDGRWWVAGRDVPAREELVLQTIRQLEALQETQPWVIRSEDDLRDRGLQLIGARFVRLTFADGRARWLRIGEPRGRLGAMAWARDAGNPLLEETPLPSVAYTTTGLPVSADINSWTSPEVIPEIHQEKIDTLRVTWRDETGAPVRYTLIQKSDSAVLVEPGSVRTANPRKVREVLGQAVSLLIDGHLEPGERAPARSKEPRVAVRIVLRGGAAYEVEAVASDARFDYVPHPAAPDVLVKLSRVRLDAFRHTSTFIATSYPYGPELDDGVSGPPPPGFAIYAPHGYHDHEDDHGHEEDAEDAPEEGEEDGHDAGHDHGDDAGHDDHGHAH